MLSAMSLIRRLLLCLVLVSPVAASQVLPQNDTTPEEPKLPALSSLQTSWWNYFGGSPDEIRPRVSAFLEQTNRQIAGLSPQNQELAPGIVEAVADNFDVYLSLLEDVDIQTRLLPEPAASYSVDDLLKVAATARAARDAAEAAQSEVEREQRILDGASRRRDALFKDYLGAADGDQRWLTGLRLVRARTEQAIAARRLEVLTRSALDAAEYADDINERVDLVRGRLAPDGDETTLPALIEAIGIRTDAVEKAEERARETQILASGLDVDSSQGRTEQRLQQQRALDAEVELALSRIALAETEARQFWTLLNMDSDPDLTLIEDKSIAWSELVREVRSQLPNWKLQTEDELLAVQSIDRDELDRAARRVLDQRIGTAQETLGHIGDLEDAVADLELLITAVEDASSVYSSAFQQWLNNVGKSIKTGWIRVSSFSSTTLFDVGETPVTPGDIVQAILILLFGWLLSRLIRHAIRRVGRRESQGRQASLYTISRLSHYTIIIVAVLIALTSMGLDFTNLALVAGAEEKALGGNGQLNLVGAGE